MNRTDELRTARIESLVTPAELALRYPVTPGVATHVTDSRRRIEKILKEDFYTKLHLPKPSKVLFATL